MASIGGMFGELNRSIRNFGGTQEAIPQDPQQRNALQQYGVTNPMLQMFGRGLGGLTGKDMRSPAEIQKEATAVKTQEAIDAATTAVTPDDFRNAAAKLYAIGKDAQADAMLARATKLEEKTTTDTAILDMIKTSGVPKEKQNKLILGFNSNSLTAKDVYKELYPNRKDQIIVAGDAFYDTATESFIPKPKDGKNPTNDRLKLTYDQVAQLVSKGYKAENVQEFALTGDPTVLGKPMDAKQARIDEAAMYKLMTGLNKSDQALFDIQKARELYSDFGPVNKLMWRYDDKKTMGDVATMATYVDSIVSKLGFQSLGDMKAASPTGGALGSVTEKENELLQKEIATIDPTADNFLQQLDRIERHYKVIRDSLLGIEPENTKTISGVKYWQSLDGNWYPMNQGAQ